LNLDKIKAYLDKIPAGYQGMVAQIGVPSGARYADGTSVAYVAAIQEFGAPAVSIPARPFLKPTIANEKSSWVESIIEGVKSGQNAFDVLDAVGRLAVADIQTTIASIDSPALSPITVLLRKWRNEGRTITGATVGEAARAIADGVDPGSDNKPLNDTGYLYDSIHNSVAKEGSEFSI
jgi:hypothetical protein